MPEVADAPATESKPDSIVEAYDRALKSANAQPDEVKKEAAKPVDTKEPAADESKAKSGVDEKAKPKSALDAVLGDAKKLEAVPDATKPDQLADEIPANAPAKLLRDALKRREAEVHHWKAEVAKAATPDTASKGQLETLQRERDEQRAENAKLRDAITALDVRYDPGHKAKFVDGRKDLVSKAAGKLKAFGGNPEALEEALTLPEGKLRSGAIKEALGELDADDRVKVMAAIERVEALEEEEAAILNDPHKAWETMTQKQQEEAQREHEAAEKTKASIFERVLKTLPGKAKLLTLLDATVEGSDDWNSGVKGAHEYGKRLLGPDATMEEIATAAIKGARYDFVEGLLLEERASHRAETEQLREQLAKYEESEPGFRGTGKTPKTDNSDKSPAQIYAETLEKLSGAGV